MNLLGDNELERSSVVANCRMNRERGLDGSNGYARELGFHPLDRLVPGQPFRWLDLCCGSGRALIEAAHRARNRVEPTEILGVDLVGRFAPIDPALTTPRLVETSLSTWNPDPGPQFDLITCVHGLHYIGDKLALIARAAGWLAEDGLFVATLDPANLRVADVPASTRHLHASFRRAGFEADPKRRLIRCPGRRSLDLPYRYLGADADAGPNFTGQPAVTSVYEAIRHPSRRPLDQG